MFDVLHTSQSFDASDVVIDTGRLMLRRWRESDAEALYRYASDGRVSEMAMWPRHTSVEMSRRVITEYFIPNSFNFAMVLEATGEPIGCIGLVPEGDENCPASAGEREVGYWIGWPYWGRGLATEALRALIGWVWACSGGRYAAAHRRSPQRRLAACGSEVWIHPSGRYLPRRRHPDPAFPTQHCSLAVGDPSCGGGEEPLYGSVADGRRVRRDDHEVSLPGQPLCGLGRWM